MKGRTPNKQEKEWMNSARDVGCIACIVSGEITPYEVPAEHTAIHHINGKTKEGAHLETIPLCGWHHQTGYDAIHGYKKEFISQYGREEFLLKRVRAIVKVS